MKIGLSTYSLYGAIQSGEMTVPETLQWIKDNGGDHVEISAVGFDLAEDPSLADAILNKASEVGIELSSYTIPAQFLNLSEEAYECEVNRVMTHVDIAKKLGITRMRHDAGFRPIPETSVKQFEEDLPKMATACRRVADYAAQHGIITSLENHGYHVQNSERVTRLIHAVDRPNYRWTVDIGNFLCVDEDPVAAVKKAMPFASMIHFKDFYIRRTCREMGEGWFGTTAGNQLRGSIVGQGDIDIPAVLKVIRDSGYDGYLSVEFEGMEDCRTGSRLGMEYLRRLLSE